MSKVLSSQVANSGTCLCPLCHMPMKDRYVGIVAEDTGERFDVEECPTCGLGHTRPEPVAMDVYYPANYYGNRHGISRRLCVRRRLRLSRRHHGAGAGQKLLDFGCGDASFLLAARDEGWDCCGVDRNPPTSIPDDMPVVRSLDELGERAPFDCVTLWHVLEHLDDPVHVLTRLRAYIKPGGHILASVPNFGSSQARYTGAGWLHLDIPRHLYHFTEPSLRKTFELAGFRVQDVSFGEIEYDVIGWSQGLLNLGLRGRNEFFKVASGRPLGRWTMRRAVHVSAGLGLSLLMAIPAWAEGLLGRAGTLVLVAQSPQEAEVCNVIGNSAGLKVGKDPEAGSRARTDNPGPR